MIAALLVCAVLAGLVLVFMKGRQEPSRAAADPDKETPPAGWSRRTFKPICKPSEHDWYLPGNDRAPYCLTCGEPMDYQPHSDRQRITGAELKPATDPRRRLTLWEG